LRAIRRSVVRAGLAGRRTPGAADQDDDQQDDPSRGGHEYDGEEEPQHDAEDDEGYSRCEHIFEFPWAGSPETSSYWSSITTRRSSVSSRTA
jgi:hypothetical protein